MRCFVAFLLRCIQSIRCRCFPMIQSRFLQKAAQLDQLIPKAYSGWIFPRGAGRAHSRGDTKRSGIFNAYSAVNST